MYTGMCRGRAGTGSSQPHEKIDDVVSQECEHDSGYFRVMYHALILLDLD